MNEKKKQAVSYEEPKSVGSMEVYNICLQRHINEDRIIPERTGIFLAGSSFLFLAFVMLLNPDLAPIFRVLRIILPVVGIFLAFLLYSLNRAAINALCFWSGTEQKIEEEAPEFTYMRENNIVPHLQGEDCIWGKMEWRQDKSGGCVLEPVGKPRKWLINPLLSVRVIYTVYLPLAFLILWLGSLVVAILD
jgi:hypothetical protein